MPAAGRARTFPSVVRTLLLAGICFGWALAAVPAARAGAEAASGHAMRGVLRAFDADKARATIAHEEVPGYMPAMTMDFDVAAPGELRGLRPGDTVTCQLRVTGSRAWIEQVHKEDSPAVASPFGAAVPASRSTELGTGDPLPDIELVDQRGETLRLHDFRGTPVAISFIYLRCPLPTYCPLLNRNFQAAQALLDRLGRPGQARFLSVSMDPANDTPARLAEYAGALGADRRTWTFATAREDALHLLGDAVGLEFQRQNGAISHNLRTVVADGRGCIRRVFRGNAWTPQELAAELRAAAAPPRD